MRHPYPVEPPEVRASARPYRRRALAGVALALLALIVLAPVVRGVGVPGLALNAAGLAFLAWFAYRCRREWRHGRWRHSFRRRPQPTSELKPRQP